MRTRLGGYGVTRREALKLVGATPLVAVALQGGSAMAEETGDRPLAYRDQHRVKPLPFDPAKLQGLSEKLITSHHQNNYGAVKRLNLIEQQIGALSRDAAPYQMGSLKREELVATNSMLLHEAYFGNLGGSGNADGAFAMLAKDAYGSLEVWEHDFRLTGMSLAGGSGWVVASYDPPSRRLHNWWAFDHTHGIAGGIPVLVMDMYEHAYHMDYGARAGAYVDAFMAAINWTGAAARYAAATKT
jgi:Fe-Mn family superoxide dismutase